MSCLLLIKLVTADDNNFYLQLNLKGPIPSLNLSGGAPLFIMCLCLQSTKDVFCSFISSSISCRYKLSCAKNIFSCQP